ARELAADRDDAPEVEVEPERAADVPAVHLHVEVRVAGRVVDRLIERADRVVTAAEREVRLDEADARVDARLGVDLPEAHTFVTPQGKAERQDEELHARAEAVDEPRLRAVDHRELGVAEGLEIDVRSADVAVDPQEAEADAAVLVLRLLQIAR